jgi:site-specific recombinase XerC
MLRHSRATHMLMDGEDPYKVAKLLGDTLATVERVYGHYDVDYLKTDSSLG